MDQFRNYFLISLIPNWWLFSVNQNNTFIMITIVKLWMIWTFWILPIIIISRFLINPVDHYGFGGPYSKKYFDDYMCINS